MYECVCFKCNKSFLAESKHAGICANCKDRVTDEHLRKALPEIIDWLEVEALVFKTEHRDGNAAFAERVVRLFKTFLSTPA